MTCKSKQMACKSEQMTCRGEHMEWQSCEKPKGKNNLLTDNANFPVKSNFSPSNDRKIHLKSSLSEIKN